MAENPNVEDLKAPLLAAVGAADLALATVNEILATLRDRAERITLRLAEACFECAPEAHGLLRDSSYSVPANRAVEQFMPFGDYYFFESLLTLTGQVVDFWGKPT